MPLKLKHLMVYGFLGAQIKGSLMSFRSSIRGVIISFSNRGGGRAGFWEAGKEYIGEESIEVQKKKTATNVKVCLSEVVAWPSRWELERSKGKLLFNFIADATSTRYSICLFFCFLIFFSLSSSLFRFGYP